MATQKGRNWSSGDIVTAANLQSIERGVSAVAEEYTPTTWANGNTVTAAALNNIEQGIANAGGGEGYLGLHTATVNVTFDTSSISGDVTEFQSARLILESNENGENIIDFWYGSDAIPVAELGDVTQMLIPVADWCLTIITPGYLTYLAGGDGIISTEITVVSGAATQREYDVAITGDCSLNIKVDYQG